MPRPNVIAIDGPAASGKSSLAFRLAKELGYLFFDTGIMYRAITWAASEMKIPESDEAAITALSEKLQIDVRPPSEDDGRQYDVLVDGEDVTWMIRSPEVEACVSQVSAYPGVRRAMTAQQRRIGLRGKVVMVGRDIGTVVMPEAELKIYLDASVEVRASRRYAEFIERGEKASLGEILAAMRRRDKIDSTRAVAPLRVAEDAIIINSDGLTFDEVLQKVRGLINDS